MRNSTATGSPAAVAPNRPYPLHSPLSIEDAVDVVCKFHNIENQALTDMYHTEP